MPDRDAQFIKDITHLLEIQVSSSPSEKVQNTINFFQCMVSYEFLKYVCTDLHYFIIK